MNTSWNHGYEGITENGCDGSHLVPMILQWPPKKKGPKGRRGQEFQVHTYPTVSSRPRGRHVQSVVQIGSEMWMYISSIHTYIHTNKHSSLYIRYLKTDPDTPYIQSWKLRLSDEDKYFNFDND
jgi:hypothetical protein